MTDKHPNASPYKDRHGRTRWRYRHKGKSTELPGEPGEIAFETAYTAVVEGRPIPKAAVVQLPTAGAPRSLKAAWLKVKTETHEWPALKPVTRQKQSEIAENFLAERIVEGSPETWGSMPVDRLERRHVNIILADRSDTPHAARHVLTILRKITLVAMDNDWIKNDPTYRMNYAPAYIGRRAWTNDEMKKFESHWPIGSTPRLCYGLALWLGNRRGDIVKMRPADIRGDVAYVVQQKGGKELKLPVTPMLREILDATDMTGPAILMTAYGQPFSAKSITGRMKDWTKLAGLPSGCTLHGLRKTLGKMLAESGATTRQIMDTLGHTNIAHAELYSREASQERLATDGMAGVVKFVNFRKKSDA